MVIMNWTFTEWLNSLFLWPFMKVVVEKAFITGAFKVLNLREANIKISYVYKKDPDKL